MTTIRRSGGSQGTVNQRDNGQTYTYTDITAGTANTMQANVATILATHAGLAFSNITIGSGVHIRSARLVFRLDTSGSNATGAEYNIYGHKVAAPLAFKASVGAGTDGSGQDLVSRFANKTTATIPVSRTTAYPSTLRVQEFDVKAIVQEVVNQGGWISGGRMVFLLINGKIAANPDYTTRFYGATNARQDLRPELYIEYGNPASDSFDFSLGILGDSHAVCAGQPGEPRTNVAITAIGWTDTLIEETYAGMVDDTSVVGDGFGSGDQVRGYSPGGLVKDRLEHKYGDDKVIVYRGDFAIGGKMISDYWFWKFVQQATDPAVYPGLPTSQPPYVYTPGQSTGPGTGIWAPIDDFMANPPSVSDRIMFWISLGANDNKRIGDHSGTNNFIEPVGPLFQTQWDTVQIPKLTDIFMYMLTTMEANDVDGLLLIPGYQNFMVKAPDPPSGWQYPPMGLGASDDPQENEVWGTSSFGVGYSQLDYDAAKTTLRPGAPANPADPYDPWILNQSIYMRLAIWRQIDINGAFSTTAGTYTGQQWNDAQVWAFNTPGSGDHRWLRTFGPPIVPSGTVTVDAWKEGFRNITDITVNRVMVGGCNYVYEQAIANVVAARPDWADRFMYYPNQTVHGPDMVNSADPTSEFAQPPRATSVKTDGIHPESARFTAWIDAYLDWLDTKVTYLPGYIPPVTNRFFLTI